MLHLLVLLPEFLQVPSQEVFVALLITSEENFMFKLKAIPGMRSRQLNWVKSRDVKCVVSSLFELERPSGGSSFISQKMLCRMPKELESTVTPAILFDLFPKDPRRTLFALRD